MTKGECRGILRKIWTAMEDRDIRALSEKICRLILDSQEWNESSSLLAYLSFGKELSLDALIRNSLNAGKPVAVPLIESQHAMSFRRLTRWHPGGWVVNRWGIREPSPRAPLWDNPEGSLILLPGLGFSEDGRRMGRGGGYYDRYLEKIDRRRNHLMGICCEACLSDAIPTTEQDIRVHTVCTESRIIRL